MTSSKPLATPASEPRDDAGSALEGEVGVDENALLDQR
jgi:hypothetical protein